MCLFEAKEESQLDAKVCQFFRSAKGYAKFPKGEVTRVYSGEELKSLLVN